MDLGFYDKYRTGIRLVLIVAGVALLVFLGYQFYLSRHFRVVSTNPSTKNVATISPFLKINYNRQLSSKGLSVTSSYSVVKSYEVQGKTLVVNLKTPMTASYQYYVKVNSISDNNGEKLVGRVFVFTPKKILSKNLPEDQKQALLKTQSQRPRSKNSIVFTGLSSILNIGVSATQVNNLQQFFFDFAPQANTISITNVAPVPHNRNSSSTSNTVNFTAQLNGKTYQARLEYSGLTDYSRLYLTDSSGAQVFDSNTVAPSGE